MLNLEQGTPLAKREDRVFSRLQEGREISFEDKDMLKRNLWARTANVAAPSNLTIRRLVLLDLVNYNEQNLIKILNQLRRLAPNLWAEGYSYWKYTRDFLKMYAEHLSRPAKFLEEHITSIERHFCNCSYKRGDKQYPAPFGDLRDEPLDSITFKLFTKECYTYDLSLLSKQGSVYHLRPYLLGCNTHTQCEPKKVTIVRGKPLGFKFYTGYDNKYSSRRERIRDTLKPRRIFSIFRR